MTNINYEEALTQINQLREVKDLKTTNTSHNLAQSEGITRWCCLIPAEPDFGNRYSIQVSQERAVVIHDMFGCVQSLA